MSSTPGFGPRNGKAVIATRIKLGDSQKIVAIAETSKGEFWSASADVIVTLAACLEDMTDDQRPHQRAQDGQEGRDRSRSRR